jgi:uracil-DNA glycosylase
MSRVFINYRRDDSEGYVGRLYDHLAQQIPPDHLFMDVQNIDPGEDFVDVLEEAVARCDVFLAAIGPRWLTFETEDGTNRLHQWNDFVRIEIASAIKQGKPIIPVLVGRATMPTPDTLPEELRPLARRNAITIRHESFTDDVARLLDVIRRHSPGAPPKTDPAVRQQKQDALKALQVELVGATESPLYEFRVDNRYFPILGDGLPDVNIMFIGEAPSKYDAESGLPFQGPSGKVLMEMLDGLKLKREDVYMTNVVMDRLPKNRDPNPDEIAFYAPFLDRVLAIVQPRVIAPLGRFAMHYILQKFNAEDKGGKISQLHGKLMKVEGSYGEVHIVPMYYPAVAIYQPTKKDILQQDFEKLRLFI